MNKRAYLIGSLRNPNVPVVANYLRSEHGLNIFDDWYAAGPEADDKWMAYEKGRGRDFSSALAGAAAQHVFAFDRENIGASQAAVLVLPAGKSGHLELGWAAGMGKLTAILLEGEPERYDVMYNFADLITNDLSALGKWLSLHIGDHE